MNLFLTNFTIHLLFRMVYFHSIIIHFLDTSNLANTNFVSQCVQFINLSFRLSVDCIMQILFLQDEHQISVIYIILQFIYNTNFLIIYSKWSCWFTDDDCSLCFACLLFGLFHSFVLQHRQRMPSQVRNTRIYCIFFCCFHSLDPSLFFQ